MDAELETVVTEMLTEFAVPGCSVAIVNRDTEYTQGFGVANVDIDDNATYG